jgi:CheY-like chemotaxis protein
MARILVIDDNPDEQRIFAAVLRHYGHEVEQAGDAASGIEWARRQAPDLILMDVLLPAMNGLRAAEVLRAAPETARTPIICLTGFDISPARALAAGCSHFLRKPVPPSRLAAEVERLARQSTQPWSGDRA